MANRVFDSWALLAFFEDEPAAARVEAMLEEASRGKQRLFLSVVNWTEVYYITARQASSSAAEQYAAAIANLPIEIVPVGDDLKLARSAAAFKAKYRMSLADAFAAALAKEKRAELVTGDPELKAIGNELKVVFLNGN